MTYGWDDDIAREMAMDGHDERIDEDDGCDTALPPELLWIPDPEDEGQLDHFMSFEEMAEAVTQLGNATVEQGATISDIESMIRHTGGMA